MNILAKSLYIFVSLLMFSGAGRAAIEDYETPPFRFSARTEVIDEQAAKLHISCILDFNDPDAKIKIQLIDPQDETIYNDIADQFIIDNWIQQANVNIAVENPEYWNAERPALYRIRFEVIRSNGEPIIEEQRIGLAQYATRDNKLVCNHTPIVIQGVQYSIERTAPFSIDDFRRDVSLMQQMNFNAARVINGEAPQEFMQVCDEMGMYVLIDVQETYAAPTIFTNQSHPCVIAWNLDARLLSVEARNAAIQRIKNMDNSHPLFVQFDSVQGADAEADGYLISGPPRSDWRFLGTSKKPMLACGLLPAIDGSIEGLDDFIAMARANSSLRGGFMQQFADQHSSEKPKPITNALFNDRSAQRQWASGFDGLVDKDRTRQLDFRQARQALDWIEIQEREADFRPNRSIELSIKNWNAFTNLSDYNIFWYILENGAVLERGEMKVNLPPQRSMKIAVRPQRAQSNPDANTYLLMQFIHGDRIASEHSVWLKPKNFEHDFTMRLRDLTWDKDWTVTTDIEESRIDHRDFIFHARTADCAWFLLAREGNMRLITEGPFLRLNRSLSPPERLQALQSGAGLPCEMREPLRVIERQVDRRGPDIDIKTRVAASVPNCSTEIEAQIDLLSSPYGFCDVRFQFNQIDTPQIITEAGLAFVVPATLDQVGWLGDGPYPSYPGLDQLSMPGFFKLAPVKSFDSGNRRRVQTLVFANDDGYGLGLLFWNGDISFQLIENGTLVQVNAAVAGKGSLGEATRFPVTENDLTHSDHWTIFRLVPFQPDAVPTLFQPWIKK